MDVIYILNIIMIIFAVIAIFGMSTRNEMIDIIGVSGAFIISAIIGIITFDWLWLLIAICWGRSFFIMHNRYKIL